MKIKDLLRFNPEAELQLLGTNYVPADLSIYGWGYGSDSDENKDIAKDVTDVLLIPTELKDNYTYKKDFYTDLVSYLDHGFMIMQPRNPYLENMRIQRQKGCLYVCGVKFETPIDKMRTSVNAGNNILCPNEPEAPKELDGGNFLVKVVIPARLKNVIMKQLEEKGITKEALLPMGCK